MLCLKPAHFLVVPTAGVLPGDIVSFGTAPATRAFGELLHEL